MHLDLAIKVEVEVDKLVATGFIREVQNRVWLTNIVPIKKKKRATIDSSLH